ncbi:MAG: c-type cytochrome [Cyclonatronaceae bacterium]
MADNKNKQKETGTRDESFRDSGDDRTIEQIHSAAMRERPLPEEGNERGPWWMYAVIICTLAFGFFYMGRYLGEVSDRAHVLYIQAEGEAEEEEEEEFDPIAEGQRVYTRVCQACHQSNGEGVQGSFPTLVGAEWVVDKPDNAVKIVLNGLQGELVRDDATYNGVMPAFDNLSDQEIAAVVSYIRDSFGNDASEYPEERVTQIRELTSDISGAYDEAQVLETAEEIAPELEEDAPEIN